MTLPEGEILRYLGYKNTSNTQPDERVLSLIRHVAADLEACANPKSAFGIYDCLVGADTVRLADVTINGKHLSGHLRGCDKAALMAVTLGAGADSLIRRYSVRDMEKAAVAQAVCAAMTEEYCDRLECEIVRKPEAARLYPITRFSPGYGDFDISCQKDILRLLDCAKRVGLTLTDGCMLIPSKSVTAVVGLTPDKSRESGTKRKCESCDNARCAYRQFAYGEVK